MAFRVFILTSSDAGSRGEREDRSGPVIEEMVTAAGYEVVGRALLPDDALVCPAHGFGSFCSADSAPLPSSMASANSEAAACPPARDARPGKRTNNARSKAAPAAKAA